MDKLAEIIKIPILQEGQSHKEYLDLLAVTLRNMLELITQNTNTIHQLILIDGGAGVVDHGGLTGLTDADHPASAIVNTPYVAGAIAATTVQAAINELADERTTNSHDHSGGDGAQIDHGGLAGLSDADHVAASVNFTTSARVLGRSTAGSGAGEEVQVSEAMQVLADNTTNNVSTAKHGYVPKAPNNTSQVLIGDGTWAAVPGITTKLIPEVAHTADATLTESDMFKLHTDRGAASGTDINLTLPSSPTNGWWVSFAHVTKVDGACELAVLGYSSLDEKIYKGDLGTPHYEVWVNRQLDAGYVITLVATTDGWYALSETAPTVTEWQADAAR